MPQDWTRPILGLKKQQRKKSNREEGRKIGYKGTKLIKLKKRQMSMKLKCSKILPQFN